VRDLYVRELLTPAGVDRRFASCQNPTEHFIHGRKLKTDLCITEMCAVTSKDVLRQEGQLERQMGQFPRPVPELDRLLTPPASSLSVETTRAKMG
jgi:hypothetical protein